MFLLLNVCVCVSSLEQPVTRWTLLWYISASFFFFFWFNLCCPVAFRGLQQWRWKHNRGFLYQVRLGGGGKCSCSHIWRMSPWGVFSSNNPQWKPGKTPTLPHTHMPPFLLTHTPEQVCMWSTGYPGLSSWNHATLVMVNSFSIVHVPPCVASFFFFFFCCVGLTYVTLAQWCFCAHTGSTSW